MDCDKKPWVSMHPQFTKQNIKDMGVLKFSPDVDGTKQPMEVYKDNASNGLERSMDYNLESFNEAREDCNWAPGRIYKQLGRSLFGLAKTAFDNVMARKPWNDVRSHTEENFAPFVDDYLKGLYRCNVIADVQTNFYNDRGAF